MSAGSIVVKVLVIIGLVDGIAYCAKDSSTMNAAYQGNAQQIQMLNQRKAALKKKKPTVKRVTSNYQKALNVANAYMKASDQLHDIKVTDYHARDKAIGAMQKYSALTVNGPMVSPLIKGWHGTVAYGGQNGKSDVLIAFRYSDSKNQLMQITTCYYHPNKNKLSGFVTYMSKTGSAISRKTLRN